MMQGAVGVSGPIIGSWLYAYRLPRDAYILSLSVLFLITGRRPDNHAGVNRRLQTPTG